jgi:hypothetical protein
MHAGDEKCQDNFGWGGVFFGREGILSEGDPSRNLDQKGIKVG